MRGFVLWLLLALAAGAAPLTLPAGNYVPGDPDVGTPATERFEYQPGLIKLSNRGRVWEIPVMTHYPPPKAGGLGVIVALQEPTEVRRPYFPLVLYRQIPGKPGVQLLFDSVRGTAAQARTRARQLWQKGQARTDRGELFVQQSLKDRWSELPAVPIADKARMLQLNRGILEIVIQTALRGQRQVAPADVIFYLVGQGYNPFSSSPLLKEWSRDHMSDPDVRALYQEVQSRYMQLRAARKKAG